jgi:hypothetical protein
MDWYPWSIYNVYFDNDSINNNSDAIINSVLVGMLEVKCKYNMEGVKQKKIVDLIKSLLLSQM